MRRIPPHVIARNRNNAEADANARYYGPSAPAGRTCARCGKPEGEHFAGTCEDWKNFEPLPTETEPRRSS
jgi:hypothetical protein